VKSSVGGFDSHALPPFDFMKLRLIACNIFIDGVHIGVHCSLGVHLICPLHLHQFFLSDQIITLEDTHCLVARDCHNLKVIIPCLVQVVNRAVARRS
jgi:hypothetical protein